MATTKTVVIKGAPKKEQGIRDLLQQFDPKQAAVTYSVYTVEDPSLPASLSGRTSGGALGILIVPTSGELDG
jgi:hypothetical protein